MSEATDATFDQLVLDDMTCCVCGAHYGMNRTLVGLRKNDGKTFWCPNGHNQVFVPPPKPRDEQMDVLREELTEARQRLREVRDELAAEKARSEQLAAARRPLFSFRKGRS